MITTGKAVPNPTSSSLNASLNAYRTDLADINLKDQVKADRYAEGVPATTAASVAQLRRAPSLGAPVDKELLRGEAVIVFEDKDGWCWLQSLRDKYVGYCHSNAISVKMPNLTHRVDTLRSLLFEEADLKSLVLGHLSLNAEVELVDQSGKFSRLSCGSWIFTDHLKPLGEYGLTFLEAAQLFLHSPYLWGGNHDLGVDCSGLVQMAALAIGEDVPRDAYMQEDFFTQSIDFKNSFDNLQINDLLFWPGHVAIYTGDGKALHANATAMKTCFHSLDFLLPHIEKIEGTSLRSVKRTGYPV